MRSINQYACSILQSAKNEAQVHKALLLSSNYILKYSATGEGRGRREIQSMAHCIVCISYVCLSFHNFQIRSMKLSISISSSVQEVTLYVRRK